MRLLLLLMACAALPALAQEGRSISPGEFERIVLDGAAQVRLRQGPAEQVFVAGAPEVQEGVQVRRSGSTLVIHTEGNWKFWSAAKPQVDVQVRELRALVISGASDVTATGPFKAGELRVSISGAGLVRFDELDAGTLRFDISGAGDGQLAGRVGELRLSVSGKGKVQAEQLRAAQAVVSISGVGNAQLWVTESLRSNVSGVGTIDYWGEPQVARSSSSGLATINPRGPKR